MSNNIRIEEDLLGTREVPAEAYYGVHTLRAIENFYISNNKISDIPEFVRGMVMVKKAAALANKELQTIPIRVWRTPSLPHVMKSLTTVSAWTSSR